MSHLMESMTYFVKKENTFWFYPNKTGGPGYVFYSPTGKVTSPTTKEWFAITIKSRAISTYLKANYTVNPTPEFKEIEDCYKAIANAANDISSVFPNMQKLKKYFTIKKITSRYGLYLIWLSDIGFNDAMWKSHFGEIPDIPSSSETRLSDKMTPRQKQEANTLLTKVKERLAAHGLDYLIKTNIVFTKLSKDLLGIYSMATGIMRINYSYASLNTAIHTVLHELGHKYYYEFLTATDHTKISEKFNELQATPSDTTGWKLKAQEILKMGDILEYYKSNNKIPRLSAVVELTNDGVYLLGISSTGKILTKKSIPVPYDRLFDGKSWFLHKEGSPTPSLLPDLSIATLGASNTWFPTSYSKTDAEEWFSENFVSFVTNNMTGEVLDFFNTIIK